FSGFASSPEVTGWFWVGSFESGYFWFPVVASPETEATLWRWVALRGRLLVAGRMVFVGVEEVVVR
ncbi:hypothetical protein A2U01_0052098, partial [Trifolium medium]|nr:hypothetical protein [Trifolium medium]